MDIEQLKRMIDKRAKENQLHLKDPNSIEVGYKELNPMIHIVFSISVWRNQKWFDIRTWVLGNSGWKPTRKGLHLSIDGYKEFKKELEKLESFI